MQLFSGMANSVDPDQTAPTYAYIILLETLEYET